MNTETTSPLPAESSLRYLRGLTEKNDHSHARYFAASLLDGLWRNAHAPDAGLSPFSPLCSALYELDRQHNSVGHISPALVALRWHLWTVVRSTASTQGLSPAFRAINACL